MVGCCRDGTLREFDLRSLAEVAVYRCGLCVFLFIFFCVTTRECRDSEYRMPAAGTRVSYSGDGQYVAAGALTGDVFLWATATQRREAVLSGGHKCEAFSFC